MKHDRRSRSLQEHFGRCLVEQRLCSKRDDKSTHSDSSVSFSETILGQLLAKEGLFAEQDFEVECKGSKKHFYATLAGSTKTPLSPFRRPTRATRVGSILPTYPTTVDINSSNSSANLDIVVRRPRGDAPQPDAVDFDGDDLYLSYSVSESFSKRIVFASNQL